MYPGRPQKAKLDQNGERIWKALLVGYNSEELWYDTPAYAMTGIAAQEFLALRWTSRLSYTIRTRIELALSITETEVDESAFCLGFWRFYRRMNADEYIEWCNAHITLKSRAVLGLPMETGMEFLHLPPAENQSQLRQVGVYLVGIFDEKGNLVGWYLGSGTAKVGKGMFQRWTKGYGKVIDNARRGVQPAQPFSASSYMQLLLKPGYTIHIRLVLLAKKAHIVGFEAHLADIVNGLNLELPPSSSPGRNEAVLAAFPDAVPLDMRDLPWKPLNLAHQLKQGTVCGNLPCSMIGLGCSHDAIPEPDSYPRSMANCRLGAKLHTAAGPTLESTTLEWSYVTSLTSGGRRGASTGSPADRPQLPELMLCVLFSAAAVDDFGLDIGRQCRDPRFPYALKFVSLVSYTALPTEL